MIHALKSPEDTGAPFYLKPALIANIDDETGQVLVALGSGTKATETFSAVPALSGGGQDLWPGQRVLVARGEDEILYIVGILDALGRRQKTDKIIRFESGARADVVGNATGLKLYSQTGGLVFEYDDASGKCRVNLPSGDMAFSADRGRMDFFAAEGFRFVSGGPLALSSQEGLSLSVSGPDEKTNRSSIELKPGVMAAESDQVDIRARSGHLNMEKACVKGNWLDFTAQDIRLSADKMETIAREMVQQVKDVYQTVEGLCQTTAGRIRTMVEESLHFKSRKIFVKAEQDVKIKGDKIHLG
ncbi:DUF3540 domain-containing protein [uncultured Desulfobacter sp.]|uniref:DUF3540 domain-containing protein n=1 Tax=uncultured Desulfobacter sp. TaxID=240139 RepID=UPI002AAC21AE|nr:DUF3540 domain-containing protein [uncultured Desulfobacter sp.]